MSMDPLYTEALKEIEQLKQERDALKAHAIVVAAAVGYDCSSDYQFNASMQAHCIENMKHFSDHLHAIEREFFMVPGEPDEDYPDQEPDDECLVNCWGSTTEQYVEQFRAALTRREALKQAKVLEELCQSMDRDWDGNDCIWPETLTAKYNELRQLAEGQS